MRGKRWTAMIDEWELYATKGKSESNSNDFVNLSDFAFAKNCQILTTFKHQLTPVSTLVHPVPVTGFTQPLQTNLFITLYMISFIQFNEVSK